MRVCAVLLLLSLPALAATSATFNVGARVIRSGAISARILHGRVHVEDRGAAFHLTRIDPAPSGGWIVTVLY